MSNDSTKNDDDELFLAEMSGVEPLQPNNKIQLKKKPRPAAKQSFENTHDSAFNDVFSDAEIIEDCPDILRFSRSGLQHKVLKKLRQGKNPIELSLDLHGLTVIAARKILIAFLDECKSIGVRHAIIVHGKGFRSKDKPVIKPMVNRWLRDVDDVLAFHTAQPKDGGGGAVYVLFKTLKSDEH
ncbi:MAG: Smr/MutS family protein [Gammaproteobacteria bacterium]|nr:Smr/MutS family protein [Gammaproteobacteria bacterium]